MKAERKHHAVSTNLPDLDNASVGITNPLIINTAALLAVFFILKELIMNNKVKFITEVAVMSALAIIFDYLSSVFGKFGWVAGGSLSIAMLPIFLTSYRHGIKGGLLVGFICGTVQIIYASSSNLIHPIQVILDYVGAYTVLGFSGLLMQFKKDNTVLNMVFAVIGIVLGVVFRLVLATLSGYFFWETALIPSFVYNVSYLAPSAGLCCVLFVVLVRTLFQSKFLKTESNDEE